MTSYLLEEKQSSFTLGPTVYVIIEYLLLISQNVMKMTGIGQFVSK